MAKPVVVVGGGVIGLSCAYYLRRRGLEVVVVERERLGSGASWGNAGWISPSLSAPLAAPGMIRTAVAALRDPDGPLYVRPSALPAVLPWFVRFWGNCRSAHHANGLRATAHLAADTMELYDELRDDGVDFRMLREGLLSVFPDEASARREADACASLREFGYDAFQVLDAAELHELEPALGPRAAAGFHVSPERSVDPSSLIAGLANRLRSMGVAIYEGWHIDRFITAGDAVSAVASRDAWLDCDHVVIATGAWAGHLLASLGLRVHLQAGKGYSLSIRPPRVPTRPIYLAKAKVGITPLGGRVRLAGSMEFSGYNRDLDTRRLAAVARAASGYIDAWAADTEADHWCGLRPITPDGLPIIGRVPGVRNATVATGHAMLGVTLAPATGRAVARIVTSPSPPREVEPFAVTRTAIHSRPTSRPRAVAPATSSRAVAGVR